MAGGANEVGGKRRKKGRGRKFWEWWSTA